MKCFFQDENNEKARCDSVKEKLLKETLRGTILKSKPIHIWLTQDSAIINYFPSVNSINLHFPSF